MRISKIVLCDENDDPVAIIPLDVTDLEDRLAHVEALQFDLGRQFSNALEKMGIQPETVISGRRVIHKETGRGGISEGPTADGKALLVLWDGEDGLAQIDPREVMTPAEGHRDNEYCETAPCACCHELKDNVSAGSGCCYECDNEKQPDQVVPTSDLNRGDPVQFHEEPAKKEIDFLDREILDHFEIGERLKFPDINERSNTIKQKSLYDRLVKLEEMGLIKREGALYYKP